MSTKKTQPVMVSADTETVKCDGGDGALGHPVVWYDFVGKGSVKCLYCGQVFTKKPARKKA